jgi:hypothetical protein
MCHAGLFKEKKMKNNIKLLGITAITLLIGLFTLSCATAPAILSAPSPENIKIDVKGRTMTVTWDEVTNATGYEIITFSENCGSGRRKINTKTGTAIVNFPGSSSNGANALLNDETNGAVVILAKNKIQITLMPAVGDLSKPMATAVTAKVMAFGGTVDGKKYLDSDYSSVVRKELGGGM